MITMMPISTPLYAPPYRSLQPSRRIVHSLWKTELCKYYATGTCYRDASKCPFAHGLQDLRQDAFEARCNYGSIPCPKLYKTKHCLIWEATGSCMYGARCLFYHNRSAAADDAQLLYADTDSNRPKCEPNEKQTRSRRLDIFCKIAP